MLAQPYLLVALLLGFALSCCADESPDSAPLELEVLKASVGVWDAEIEVWPQGPEADSIKFKGVETIEPFGAYWIASDFASTYMGHTMKIHSIVGYDLDRQQLVGTVIDHGPYAATMTGNYDAKSKAVRWTTKAKDASGKRLVQRTVITQAADNVRVLVLSVPGEQREHFNKFMQITFLKRKNSPAH